jgi:hypothetical protein
VKTTHKVPIGYVLLLAVAAGLVSFIGATFSVSGLAKLFSGAPKSVTFMAGSLEFAKVVTAGFLHQNWVYLGRPLKVYLSSAVMALIMITSLGIFGYLSHAYQTSSVGLKNVQIQIDGLTKSEQEYQEETKRIQASIDEIPSTRITKKMELQKQMEPELERLKKQTMDAGANLQRLLVQKQGFQTEIGPLAYVADAFNLNMDYVARWLIMLFVCVFDPLAICLVFAVSWSLKTRKFPMPSKEDEYLKAVA